MSHRWVHGDTVFMGNSDLSGWIEIEGEDLGPGVVGIPFADLAAFVHSREAEAAADPDPPKTP